MNKEKEGKDLLDKEDIILEQFCDEAEEDGEDQSDIVVEELITRAEFMAGVDMTRAVLLARRDQAACELATVEAEIESLLGVIERVLFAEDSGMRVRFTRTSEGQYGFESEPKGQCGFSRNGNGKRE